jgi:LIVCS family branched-chain amino acid:cation transporter
MFMKNTRKDAIVIGAALFAMFFGAGNLIFPPAIGLASGSQWVWSLLGFLVTGIGLPVMGVLAVSKAGGTISDLANKVSPKFSVILGTIVILAIGPLLAIPRTGATVYEIGIKPMLNVHPLIVSIIYFSITLFFVIKPSGVIDKVGKILTPILLAVIGLIIANGVINPIGTPAVTKLANPFSNGFLEGYQTMDTLGSIVMGGIILGALLEKGYTDRKEQMRMTTIAGLLAGGTLAIVYGGLLYLGATGSGVLSPDLTKTALIIEITNRVLGSSGQLIMCVAVSAACLTTSIGLTAIVGNYFESLSKGKLKYQPIVIFTCAFSALMSVIGVEAIVKVAVPLLVLVYPMAIVLIVFNLVSEWIPSQEVFQGGIFGAFIIGLLDALSAIELGFVKSVVSLLEPVYQLVAMLPFAKMGFAWILPTLSLAFVGAIVGAIRKGKIGSAVAIEE